MASETELVRKALVDILYLILVRSPQARVAMDSAIISANHQEQMLIPNRCELECFLKIPSKQNASTLLELCLSNRLPHLQCPTHAHAAKILLIPQRQRTQIIDRFIMRIRYLLFHSPLLEAPLFSFLTPPHHNSFISSHTYQPRPTQPSDCINSILVLIQRKQYPWTLTLFQHTYQVGS